MQHTTTRWISHSYALQIVLDTLEAVLDLLDDMQNQKEQGLTDKEAVAVARGLLLYFTSEDFLLTA